MKNRNLDTKKMPKSVLFYPLLLFVATLFMAIGFASINPFSLEVKGSTNLAKDKGVFISNVVSNGKGTDADYALINTYHGTNLSTTVTLSETETEDAYVTLKVTLKNATDYEYTFKGITYDEDIEICYDNDEIRYVYNVEDGTKIPANGSIDINLTFSYKSHLSDDFSNVLNSLLNFDVVREHNITYTNLTGSYPETIEDGEDLVVDFTSEHPDTLTIKVDGVETDDYTYTNYVLTLEDVTGDVEIIGPESSINAKIQILEDNTPQSASTITDIKTSTQSGLFSTTTSLGMTYFFRGNVSNNYISFAGKCFKIVRINENDSIKAAYTGEAMGDGSCPTSITIPSSLTNVVYNTQSNSEDYLRYAYLDGGNIVSSNAKTLLENWFASNFVGSYSTTGSEYSTYFGDGVFCNEIVEDYKYKTDIYYTTYQRASNAAPSLECPNNDSMTLKVSNGGTRGYGNNLLTYPVGLLSSDEILYTSITSPSKSTIRLDQSTYLYISTQQFSMSPAYYSPNAYMTGIGVEKLERLVTTSSSMLPIVNFKSDLLFASGDGTSSNPYKVSY